jgi:hypothetical protein
MALLGHSLLGHSRAWNCLGDFLSPVCLDWRFTISQLTGCTRLHSQCIKCGIGLHLIDLGSDIAKGLSKLFYTIAVAVC